MIVKSYELKKNRLSLLSNNFFLLYGENVGLKKDIKNFISNQIKEKDDKVEVSSLYENEILDNKDDFFNLVFVLSEGKLTILEKTT